MTIRVVFWDIGGVLLSNGWDREQRAAVLTHFNLDVPEFTERHKMAVPELERGHITLDEYLKQTVFYAPRSFAVSDFRAAILAQSQPHADVLTLARSLAGRHRMYALNNEGQDLNAYRIRTFALNDFLLGFFTSCYLGMLKPSPAIYHLGLQLAQVQPDQAVMIDDRIQNVEAARSVGMQAIQFTDAEALQAALASLDVK